MCVHIEPKGVAVNQVDTQHGRQDVTQPAWKDGVTPKGNHELAPGDVIALPFDGYGDILCEITDIALDERGRYLVSLTDGQFAYLHELPHDGSVLTYVRTRRGEVRR